MKLFFAGNTLQAQLEQALFDAGAVRRLWTYWEISGAIGKSKVYQASLANCLARGQVFIDSGAFSAFTHDSAVDLVKYGEYLAQLGRDGGSVTCACSLDVIGDHAKTQANYQALRRFDLPFPLLNVVHNGASTTQIRQAIDACRETDNFICVGGLVPLSNRLKVMLAFLDKFWSVAKEYPGLRVHCLGVMNLKVLSRYPFYSADSSSAIVGAGMGRVMLFDGMATSSMHYTNQKKVTHKTFHCVDQGKTHHGNRRIHNVKTQLAMEAHLHALWTKKGFTWTD